MRKTARRTRKPARSKLPLVQETVRTLDPSELPDINGAGAITQCPTTMSMVKPPDDI